MAKTHYWLVFDRGAIKLLPERCLLVYTDARASGRQDSISIAPSIAPNSAGLQSKLAAVRPSV